MRPSHSCAGGLREACIGIAADAVEQLAEATLLMIEPLGTVEAPGQALDPLQPQAFLADTLPLHGFRPTDLVALADEPVETAGHRVNEKAVESIIGVERIDDVDLRLSELLLLSLQPNELLLGELVQSLLHALNSFHLAEPVVHARYPFASQIENAVLKWVMKSPTVK